MTFKYWMAGIASLSLLGAVIAQPAAKTQPEADKARPAEKAQPSPKAEPAQAAPAKAEPAKPAEETRVHVTLKTSMGEIVLELNPTAAPKSVENFMKYVDSKFYDGTVFHRVVPKFVVQGGGFTADMKQKSTNPPVENEWKNGLKNVRGAVAMARLGRQPNSATSQFFINLTNLPALDEPRDGAGYAVFGRVVSGMDVVDKMANVETGSGPGGLENVPVKPIVIESARRSTPDEVAKLKGEQK